MTWQSKYTVVRHLGTGGYGEVWLVLDRAGRPRALKRLKDRAWDFVEALRDEARKLVRLHGKPGIVQLIDHGLGDDEHDPYIVMEFADGGNLLQYLTAPMAPNTAASIVLALVCAVQESHRHGVVHRDIKPENVLMKDGQVKLTDFGLAKGHESMLLTIGGQGTPGYMAPEQAVGPAIPASDVFGVGATLFHLLTAVRPPKETVDLNPAALVTACPAVLASLVMRMTHQDPRQRPSLDLVAASLRGYLASTAPRVAPRPRPAGPTAGQALGGLALLGIVLVGLSKLLGGGRR